jgi:hypothetical protein
MDHMRTMARRLKVRTKRLSIALALIAALTPDAHGQMATHGVNSGIGDSNGAASGPATRAPLLTYGVDAGIGESDNVTLVSTDKINQTIAVADADFAIKEQSRLLDVNAKGAFTYLDYLQNAYGGQLLGRFDGVAKVAIVPERFTWVAQDDFGQAALDPYTAVTPTNLEQVNYFSTGPDLTMRLGSVNFASFSARYARAQYQTSPYNSNRALGNAALGHDLSASSTVSLNVAAERVMFANTVVNTDFDSGSGYVRYALHGARTDFTGDLGATRISQAGESTTGGLAKIILSRTLSAASTLTLTAGHGLTDASISFSTQQAGAIGGISTAPAAQTANSYTINYASVGWQYVRFRTTFGLDANWEKDAYAGQPSLDVKRPGADFSVERRLTRSLTARLLGRLYKTDYLNANIATANASSNYETGLIGGSLIWRGGRSLEIILRADHNSWVVTGPGSGYRENRAFLTVGYRPRPADEPTDSPQP